MVKKEENYTIQMIGKLNLRILFKKRKKKLEYKHTKATQRIQENFIRVICYLSSICSLLFLIIP